MPLRLGVPVSVAYGPIGYSSAGVAVRLALSIENDLYVLSSTCSCARQCDSRIRHALRDRQHTTTKDPPFRGLPGDSPMPLGAVDTLLPEAVPLVLGVADWVLPDTPLVVGGVESASCVAIRRSM